MKKTTLHRLAKVAMQPVLGGVLGGKSAEFFQDGVLEDGWKCEV